MKAEKKTVFDDINITPLTDIFLVLLIIMMVVAPLLEYRQIDIAVASPTEVAEEEATPADDAKSILIRIDAGGAFTVDGDPVPAESLVAVLRDKVPNKPDGLLIVTHPDSDFDYLAKAMDAARRANVVHLNVARMDITPPPPPAPEPKKAPAPRRR